MRSRNRDGMKAGRGWLAAAVALLGCAIVLLVAGVPSTAAVGTSPFTPASGSPFTDTGSHPFSLAFSPSGTFVAVANSSSHDVSMYAVGSGGVLTQVAGSPFADDDGTESLAFSPDGSLLATANSMGGAGSGSLLIYTVGASGYLAESHIDDSDLPAGADPTSVAFSPNGEFLAVADSGADRVSVFTVSSDGSGLTEVSGSPFVTPSQPLGVAFSPNGAFLASANSGDDSVSVFSVSATGVLSSVPGSPFSAGSEPHAVAFSPDGTVLAAPNYGADNVSVFSVASNGALSQSSGSPFTTGAQPFSVAFSPYGGLLATADSAGNTASVFSYTAAGELTPVPGPPLSTGNAPNSVAFSPLGGLLATANNMAGNVSVFAYPTGPPTASIATPANGATLTVGQAATATFSCTESAYGPGLASCDDSDGTKTTSGGSVTLDTSKAGTFTYTVTATSRSGQTGSASISYQVNPPTPATTTTTVTSSTPGATATLSSVKTAGPLATLVIDCSGPAGGTCTGRATVTSHVRKRGTTVLAVTAIPKPKPKPKPKTTTAKVTVATAGFSIAAGRTATVRVTLNATGKKLLAQLYRVKATLAFTGVPFGARVVSFAYPVVASTVAYRWHSNSTGSSETELVVRKLPAAARIVIGCKGGGCPFAQRHITVKKGSSYSLTKLLARAHLHPGARLSITIEAANKVGAVLTFVIKGAGRSPTLTAACLPPGDTAPARCHA